MVSQTRQLQTQQRQLLGRPLQRQSTQQSGISKARQTAITRADRERQRQIEEQREAERIQGQFDLALEVFANRRGQAKLIDQPEARRFFRLLQRGQAAAVREQRSQLSKVGGFQSVEQSTEAGEGVAFTPSPVQQSIEVPEVVAAARSRQERLRQESGVRNDGSFESFARTTQQDVLSNVGGFQSVEQSTEFGTGVQFNPRQERSAIGKPLTATTQLGVGLARQADVGAAKAFQTLDTKVKPKAQPLVDFLGRDLPIKIPTARLKEGGTTIFDTNLSKPIQFESASLSDLAESEKGFLSIGREVGKFTEEATRRTQIKTESDVAGLDPKLAGIVARTGAGIGSFFVGGGVPGTVALGISGTSKVFDEEETNLSRTVGGLELGLGATGGFFQTKRFLTKPVNVKLDAKLPTTVKQTEIITKTDEGLQAQFARNINIPERTGRIQSRTDIALEKTFPKFKFGKPVTVGKEVNIEQVSTPFKLSDKSTDPFLIFQSSKGRSPRVLIGKGSTGKNIKLADKVDLSGGRGATIDLGKVTGRGAKLDPRLSTGRSISLSVKQLDNLESGFALSRKSTGRDILGSKALGQKVQPIDFITITKVKKQPPSSFSTAKKSKGESKDITQETKSLNQLTQQQKTTVQKGLESVRGEGLRSIPKQNLQTTRVLRQAQEKASRSSTRFNILGSTSASGVTSSRKQITTTDSRIDVTQRTSARTNQGQVNFLSLSNQQKTNQIQNPITLTNQPVTTLFRQPTAFATPPPTQNITQQTTDLTGIRTGTPTTTTQPPLQKPTGGGTPFRPPLFRDEGTGRRTGKQVPYDVFIKKKKIADNLSKKRALDFGSFVVDNVIEAQFKIKKSKGKLKNPPIKTPPNYFNFNKNKFRNFRVRKGKRINLGNTYIERQRVRLDTSGEVNDITASRFIANRRRGIFGKASKVNINKRVKGLVR